MKVITPGHTYVLDSLEGKNPQTVQFIHKEPDMSGLTANEVTMGKVPPYATVADGTTNEEVIEMLIDRLSYLQTEHQGGKFKCKANACAITQLEEALHWLNARTFERMKRGVEGKHVV